MRASNLFFEQLSPLGNVSLIMTGFKLEGSDSFTPTAATISTIGAFLSKLPEFVAHKLIVMMNHCKTSLERNLSDKRK